VRVREVCAEMAASGTAEKPASGTAEKPIQGIGDLVAIDDQLPLTPGFTRVPQDTFDVLFRFRRRRPVRRIGPTCR